MRLKNTYSKVIKVGDKMFRYNYMNGEVEWVLTDRTRKETSVVDSIGLRLENWKDKESRTYYLQQWSEELEEELWYMMKNELSYEKACEL